MLYKKNKFKYKQFIFSIIVYFIALQTILPASEKKEFNKNVFCENTSPELFINENKLNKIIIKTNKTKKWSENILDLFYEFNSEKFKTHNSQKLTFQINDKFKKKFKSKIKFLYKNPDYECESKANVNIRGDFWWHLDWKGGPFSSLKVDLKDGHLDNTVSFNLLLPKSRISANNGNINFELFVTSLLNKVGFLAPKTKIIKVEINGYEYDYLFQESLSKEFLESRGLVEGPLLEGDQQYGAEQFSANKWRGDLVLGKIINTSYSIKNKINTILSFQALSVFNNILIDNYGEYNREKTRCVQDNVTLNKKKYLINDEELKINQTYESLIFATETDHSLSCDDRRFYLDPIKNILHPIYNDGKSELNILNEKIYHKLSYGNANKDEVLVNAIEGSSYALKLLNGIDDKTFYEELRETGFKWKYEDYKKIKEKVMINLKALNQIKIKKIKKEESNSNYFENISSDYFGEEFKLVFFNLNNNYLEVCDFELKDCTGEIIKDNYNLIYKSLLNQNFKNLIKKEISLFNADYKYLFLSTSKDYRAINNLKNLKKGFIKKNINNLFNIEYNSSTNVLINNEEKNIKFTLSDINSRILITGTEINSWTFEIDGSSFYKNLKDKNISSYVESRLTGCLTFMDVKLKNINLRSNYSLCEDSFNFIRAQGKINSVEINDSLSDAIDFDFSNIEIASLIIRKAKNDCIDMSFGIYKIDSALLYNCGDKGISVGEKSILNIENVEITKANIGIASKDSSIVNVKNSDIKAENCFASYRKKQEFSGSILRYKKTNCNVGEFIIQKGSLIVKQ